VRLDPVTDDPRDEHAVVFKRAEKAFGWVPNTVRVMANGQAAMLYLDAHERNAGGSLTAAERELLAIVTAAHNECSYCLTAHSVAARGLGVTEPEVQAAQSHRSPDPRREAMLGFAASLLESRGHVSDELLQAMADNGFAGNALVDIVSVVVENCLGNFINNLAQTEIDGAILRAAERVGPEAVTAGGVPRNRGGR